MRKDGHAHMKNIRSTHIILLFVVILGLSFIVGCVQPTVSDVTAPTVASAVPIDGTTGVALNGTINVTFDKSMSPSTISVSNFTLMAGASPVDGIVTYDDASLTATFTPIANLAVGTAYTATITTGMKDSSGNALAANMSWSFTTGAAVDNTPPTVISMVPANGSSGIAVTDSITANFSEGMNIATINTTNFTVKAGSSSVAGSVVYDVPNHAAVFAPTANLAASTVYTATVKTGVKDLAGNALVSNAVWTFTTAATGAGPAPVNLRTAGNFVILAKTAITNVPTSAITGDVGLSPAAESYITGFSQTKHTGYSTSPQVTGFIYAADMTPPTPAKMTTAISDMQTAYTDAAGRPLPDFTNLYAGNLGGRTLAPGLYKWGSSVTIPTNVTVSGGANDVWIFQISGDLTVSSATSVLLIGAQAKNIFWQVAGQVILGTTAHFEGIILSQTQITLQTGASMNGRALAQTQVVLSQNSVTKP